MCAAIVRARVCILIYCRAFDGKRLERTAREINARRSGVEIRWREDVSRRTEYSDECLGDLSFSFLYNRR